MRIFKTKWFAREASSHGISDDELYQAIQSALQGKVVDLGGGVYKKRLNKNRDRAIILTKSAVWGGDRFCMHGSSATKRGTP